MTYNGYPNWETWNVALWIDNEQSTQTEVTAKAREFTSAYNFAGWLQHWAETKYKANRVPASGPVADIFRAGWHQIDWQYLADSYISQAKEISE